MSELEERVKKLEETLTTLVDFTLRKNVSWIEPSASKEEDLLNELTGWGLEHNT